MDWTAFALSLELAAWTSGVLLPLAVLLARPLAWRRFPGKSLVEALVTLPLVLPPTVLGFLLLVAFGGASPLGQAYQALVGRPLVFTFQGLLLASILFNLPFAVRPVQLAFEAIGRELREAAWLSGMSAWRTFWRIELPLAWPGVLTAFVLTFAHTMGEFGVVLMVGGNLPGATKTISIAIYDRVQAFDDTAAAAMAGLLLAFSFVSIVIVQTMAGRTVKHRG
jgi:molybdate transport system permease protein